MLKSLKPPTRRTETRTMSRLRQKMREVQTWVQFEEIIAAVNEDDRGATRKLLEPMLRADLPCCGPAMLCTVTGRALQHAPRCPMLNKVKLYTN